MQGKDTGSLFDAVEKSEGRLKAIIRADPDLDKAAVKKYHAAGVRGIRLNLVGRLHGGYDATFFERSVAHAVDAGWVVTMHIDTDHLVKLADVIRKIPGNAVLDNFVMIDARPGKEEPTFSVLMDLLKEPNVWIKCAAAYRMLKKGSTHEQMVAMSKKIHAASPDRSLWGSNWPHSDYFKPGQMPNDGDLIDYLSEFVPDPVSLRKLMADNPKRLFDF